MKDHVDKSIGIVPPRMSEDLPRIKPTEPLRLTKRDKKRNCYLFLVYLQQNKKG
jgi:hypothetical protein